MHNLLIRSVFIVFLGGCAQHANQGVQPGTSKNDVARQQQFDAAKGICWAEIRDKYNCFPPIRERAFIRGQADVHSFFMEAQRFCDRDGLSPQGGGSVRLIRLINYMGDCLTKKKWANLWCCDKF